ncbi:bifunctional adenosylcobinamide kinase/adenosylcobinamide-phosphate guanylyltransferase [Alkalicoccus daliensis]|uniref:Adenosylcobinamide kinase n=1 Tax=Alkalicoccus daliensis TaxID=745820 RepID=A0A1H0HZ02_9BACI|nr:bifunctional adenosylcobinamide kinase/adenosylcobinamide-phosphate guanylyltransferase [Alkalicoccus daliensis]SDO24432.1 adenosylcobinamide kinase /adenosylcobinamide-phosphate guanylyltransferase [Alkalicoccus daliensis]
MITFISGGARSGKSSFAEKEVLKQSPAPVFIATSSRSDEEMIFRIEKHQKDRASAFITKEAEFHIEDTLKQAALGEVLLVDCLTVWLNEAMFQQKKTKAEIMDIVENWCEIISAKDLNATFVSNDINEGGLPPDPGTQAYVEVLEKIHRKIIAHAEKVIQVRAGIPHYWKEGKL